MKFLEYFFVLHMDLFSRNFSSKWIISTSLFLNFKTTGKCPNSCPKKIPSLQPVPISSKRKHPKPKPIAVGSESPAPARAVQNLVLD